MKQLKWIIFIFFLQVLQLTHLYAQQIVPLANTPAANTAVTTAPANAQAAKNTTAATTTPLPTPVGKVIWVKGTLKAIMPNKEVRNLQKESVIYLHDTLVTEANSQAQIAFTDNTLMTFRPDSKFYVNQYEYNPEKKKGSVGTYVMNLIEGGFRTITGLIAKNDPADYHVNTPVATIGVRGTDYAIFVHNGEMYVGYYTGTPCVNNKKGTLCLDKNTPYTFVPNAYSPPVPMQTPPEVFREKLVIVPATVKPFAGAGGKSGTVGGFCITN